MEWRAVRMILSLLFLALGTAIFLSAYYFKHQFDPYDPKDWMGAILIWSIVVVTLSYFYFQKPASILKRDFNGVWIRFTGRKFRNSLPPLELPKRR